MDAVTQLVILCACAGALGEPLGAALRRHSHLGAYAREFAHYSHDYEPYVYAAIPLHAPMPVLRVLSPAPLTRERKPAPAAHHSVYAPSSHHPVYAPFADEYAPSTHDDYDASYEVPQYAPQHAPQHAPLPSRYRAPQLYAAASSAPEEPTILYARPTASGGYTYHSAPTKQAGKRAPPPSDSPYIIRVHKYRLVKER